MKKGRHSKFPSSRTRTPRPSRREIQKVLELMPLLTGQRVPFPENQSKVAGYNPFPNGIGYSQLNELLLTLGYDRVEKDFFEYLFGDNSTVMSLKDFERGIEGFRKDAMLLFGNIKYGFKNMSRMDKAELSMTLAPIRPVKPDVFASRHATLHKIQRIAPDDAYNLGYIIERELREKLASDKHNADLKRQLDRIAKTKAIARLNHDTYLSYDHMDVYIATSMREKHEFLIINDFIRNLFADSELKTLKLRWFDPTQAYCKDRIDKGLVEGLMVKRAKCTIYHVQEADTLGKDSELAATLAQGKPVIAYIPQLKKRDEFIRAARVMAQSVYPDLSFRQLVLDKFLRVYYQKGAWEDPMIQGWLSGKIPFNERKAEHLLFRKAKEMYDRRATTLREDHPLGLQVNLDTGVSNGVLVVRTIRDCALLLRNIMLNTMEFDLEKKESEGKIAWYLRERISKCIYRFVTGDELLTNSFWNFYLRSTPSYFG